MDTPVTLMREVGRTVLQLRLLAIPYKGYWKEDKRAYKSIFSAVRQLGTGASTDRAIPKSSKSLPLITSTARPQIKDTVKPVAPMGKKRRAVWPADSWSISWAMRTR